MTTTDAAATPHDGESRDAEPPPGPVGSPLERVAGATRRLNRLVRITTADPAALAAAEAKLAEAAELLEASVHPGPHCQVGHGEGEVFRDFADPAAFFPYSPVVGPLNPVSPPVQVQIADDGRVTGTMTLTEAYNGPPWDLTHGGVVAMVFDELLGIAGIAGAGGGFTGRLTIRYRKPTPILAEIALEAWLDRVEGRKLIAKGEMRHNGVLTADAEGLFVKAGGILSEHGSS